MQLQNKLLSKHTDDMQKIDIKLYKNKLKQ